MQHRQRGTDIPSVTLAVGVAKPSTPGVEHIVAVVPVHNEQTLLRSCLEALSRAADRSPVPVTVVVSLDACTDDSAAIIAEQHRRDDRFSAIVVDEHNVGAARAAGCGTVAPAPETWIACTDADSVVPPDWFRTVASSGTGVDVIAGTVTVSQWREHDFATAARYQRLYATTGGEEHRHIHGANIAFRSTAYAAVGGFTPRTSGEDVDLLSRFEGCGHRIVWLQQWTVETSDRRCGRAPNGFAAHLLSLGTSSTTITQDSSPEIGAFETDAAPVHR